MEASSLDRSTITRTKQKELRNHENHHTLANEFGRMKLGEFLKKNKIVQQQMLSSGKEKMENEKNSQFSSRSEKLVQLRKRLTSLWNPKLDHKLLKLKPQQQQGRPNFLIESDGLLRLCLTTQGTTVNFYFGINFISMKIDSRETYDGKYIVEEDLKKYEIFGQKILVAFVGDVKIGQGILEYLQCGMRTIKPKHQNTITVEMFESLALRQVPITNRETEIVIVGFLPTGVPSVSNLIFKRSARGTKVDKIHYRNIESLSLGSGKQKLVLHSALDETYHDFEIAEKTLNIAMASSCVKDKYTGGFIYTVNMHFACPIEEYGKRTISYLITYFDMWTSPLILFLLYPRDRIDREFFDRWIAKKMGRKKGTINFLIFPISQLKLEDDGRKLAFAVVRVDMEKYANEIITRGTKNKKLTSELVPEYKCDSKKFYFLKPSLAFLEANEELVESFDEYDLAFDADKKKRRSRKGKERIM